MSDQTTDADRAWGYHWIRMSSVEAREPALWDAERHLWIRIGQTYALPSSHVWRIGDQIAAIEDLKREH